MSRQGSEIIAGPTAIQQALFFHFRLTLREIATAMNVKYTTVYSSVWRQTSVMPWEIRKHKSEAIAAAALVLEHLNREKMNMDSS